MSSSICSAVVAVAGPWLSWCMVVVPSCALSPCPVGVGGVGVVGVIRWCGVVVHVVVWGVAVLLGGVDGMGCGVCGEVCVWSCMCNVVIGVGPALQPPLQGGGGVYGCYAGQVYVC